MESWNPVLNFVHNLKVEAAAYIDVSTAAHPHIYPTCIEYWESVLENTNYYCDIINNLIIKQMGNLVIFKYKGLMVDFDIYEGFFRECRGVVIDVIEEKIVIAPYRKFFNLNEKPETQLREIEKRLEDPYLVEVVEKLDGSMIAASMYHGRPILSSSGNIETDKCDQLISAYGYLDSKITDLLETYPDYTFIFELIDSSDPHVIAYDKSQYGLHLIGMRNKLNGSTMTYHIVETTALRFDLPYFNTYDLSFGEALNQVKERGLNLEGYVINIDGYRIKLKLDEYLSLQKVKNSFNSPNAILDCIRDETFDDIYSKMPYQYHPMMLDIVYKTQTYVADMTANVNYWYDECYYGCANSYDRKTFMIYVTERVPHIYQGYVRAKYLGQNIDYLKGINWQDILERIG